MCRQIIFPVALLLLGLASCAPRQPETAELSRRFIAKTTWQHPLPPEEFRSDGCSCWLDNGWLGCCIQHDVMYWMGGSNAERRQADLALKDCVTEKGHPHMAQIMYWGARTGGVWWLPTPFRWGFGWNYPQSGPPVTTD